MAHGRVGHRPRGTLNLHADVVVVGYSLFWQLDDEDEDESETVAMPGAFPTEPQDPPEPRFGHTIPIIGHRVRGGGPRFRIGFAGRGGGGPIL